jgi:hypothetical protein
MARNVVKLAAILGLCLGTSPVMAVPLEECTAAEHGWLSSSEIGTFDTATGDFAPSAIAPEDAAPLEYALAHAASFYGNTLRLTAPPTLQCVADPDSGEMRYAFIVDPALGDFGEYNSAALALWGVPDVRIATEVVNAYTADSERFVTPPHELFHAVEAGYPLFTAGGACTRMCARTWVVEGMADAFAYGWMRNYQITGSGGRVTLDRQLPHLDDPLHLPANKDQAYARSYFWSYLAWQPKYVYVYKDKKGPTGQIVGLAPKGVRFDPRLMVRFMTMTNPLRSFESLSSRGPHWELEWLDEVLKQALNKAIDDLGIQIPRDLEGGMFVIYPKYAAWMMGHLTTGVSDTKRDEALGGMFRECRLLPVSANPGSAEPETVQIADLSTACFLIKRPEGRENDTVDVTMEGPAGDLSRIHMGWNGGVVVPSVDNGRVKTWRLGLPQGDSPSNPTGALLWLAVSNVAEKLQATVSARNNGSIPVSLKANYIVSGP